MSSDMRPFSLPGEGRSRFSPDACRAISWGARALQDQVSDAYGCSIGRDHEVGKAVSVNVAEQFELAMVYLKPQLA